MTPTLPTPDDHVSALMDGELQGSAQQASVETLLKDARAQEAWHRYHLIGDILRSDELAAGARDLEFLTKLESRLSQETMAARVEMPERVAVLPPDGQHHTSANSDRFRWRMAAGGALTLALAVMAVFVLEPNMGRADIPMAVAPQIMPDTQANVVAISVAPDGMIRDPRLDQLLSAHQQLGGHSALQMPSGFLRNATYDGKGR